MGKNFARLDNHLSRYHKGVTRGMNDCQPLPSQSNQKRVTCLLPDCGRDIIHLSLHLKNRHSNMSIAEYNSVVRQLQDAKEKKIKRLQEDLANKIKDKGLNIINVEEEKVEKITEHQVNVITDDSEVLAPDSEPSEVESGVESEGGEQGDGSEQGDIPSDQEINHCSDEKLRFLVHNTTPDGVRFLLSSLQISGSSIKKFRQSQLCRAVLGELPVSTLQDIYCHRKYLTSFYRLGRYYPYPDKKMICSCLACGAVERGRCSCPVLPESFYVFCRQRCSSEWNCKKCINFDRGPSHACFDFFHCTVCHERYVASTKYQPYP